MDKINFCGYQNIGFFKRIYTNDEILNPKAIKDGIDEMFLSVQLKDDFNGHDLTEFKKAFKKAEIEKNPNPIGNDFVNIAVIKEYSYEDAKPVEDITFFVNDNRLDVNDENLGFLSHIIKLVRKISETSTEKFVHKQDFVNGFEAPRAIILNEDLEAFGAQIGMPNLVKNLYTPEMAKDGAKQIYESMQNVMVNYFA